MCCPGSVDGGLFPLENADNEGRVPLISDARQY